MSVRRRRAASHLGAGLMLAAACALGPAAQAAPVGGEVSPMAGEECEGKAASASVSAQTVEVGDRVTITGTCFAPREARNAYIDVVSADGTPTRIETATASDGSVSGTYTTVAEGEYTAIINVDGTQANTSFTVVAAEEPPPTEEPTPEPENPTDPPEEPGEGETPGDGETPGGDDETPGDGETPGGDDETPGGDDGAEDGGGNDDGTTPGDGDDSDNDTGNGDDSGSDTGAGGDSGAGDDSGNDNGTADDSGDDTGNESGNGSDDGQGGDQADDQGNIQGGDRGDSDQDDSGQDGSGQDNQGQDQDGPPPSAGESSNAPGQSPGRPAEPGPATNDFPAATADDEPDQQDTAALAVLMTQLFAHGVSGGEVGTSPAEAGGEDGTSDGDGTSGSTEGDDGASDGGGSDELAETGAETAGTAALAALALTGGAGLLWYHRRRSD